MVFIDFSLFAVSLLLLLFSGAVLVRSSSKLAVFLRLPEFLVGFVILAVATSVPELFVGISSALKGDPSLSLGNVIGSNIINLTLVAGLGVLLAGKINIKSKVAPKDALFMLFLSFLPLVLLLVGRVLSRFDGVLLILVFLGYFYYTFRLRRRYSKKFENAGSVSRWGMFANSFLFFGSLVLLFFSASWTVRYGISLASLFGFPSILVGLFLIALGTSLPELVFTARACSGGHGELAFGDLIGSNIFNALLILGVTSVIFPIKADFFLFISSGIYMLVVSTVFVSFVQLRRFSSFAGVALILLYMFFIILEFYIKLV